MKNKRKITTIFILTVLIAIAGTILFKSKNSINIENNTENNNTVINTKIEYNGSAYDYIIDEMSKPEYWDEKQMHDYFTDEEIELRKDKIPNGSGWYLSDPKTASFSRGYEYTMTYNFADFTASYDDGVLLNVYDFKNDKHLVYFSDDLNTVQYEYEPLIGVDMWTDDGTPYKSTLEEAGESMFYIGDITSETVSFIKNSMMNYAYQFELAGCPILLQPEGTLESYKNAKASPDPDFKKTAWSYGDYYERREYFENNEPTYVWRYQGKEPKIDYVWQQERYTYDLRNNTDIQWVDDYRNLLEVLDKVPESEPDTMLMDDGNGNVIESNSKISTASHICIVFVNKDYYEQYFKNEGVYPNFTSNFFAYVARPILEKAYGFDAVYFCDTKVLSNQVPVDIQLYDKDFEVFGLYLGDETSDAEITAFKEISGPLESSFMVHNFNDVLFEDAYITAYGNYSDVCTKFGLEWPFTDNYKMSFLLTVSEERQKMFGLR